jgi:hypothetical protein
MRAIVLTFALILMLVGISSCDHIQGDREIETDPKAMPKGPGLLTGRSGVWTIIRK